MKCIIVDIDGTLANNKHRSHHLEKKPKDWDAFNAAIHLDTPHQIIVDMVNALSEEYWVVLCSGRQGEHRLITEEWLVNNGINYDGLFMRTTGDFRPDEVIKLELLAEIRAAGYDPQFVIDDRNKVVKAWREAGLICLQCAEGDF